MSDSDDSRFISLDKRVARMEDSLQALSSLASSLAQSNAVFEFKYDQSAKLVARLEEFVSRIGERDEAAFKKTMELLNDREQRLADQLRHYREMMNLELVNRESALATKFLPLQQSIDQLKLDLTEESQKNEALKTRVDALEKWLWMVMGGAIVISYIIQNIAPLLQ